MKRKDRARKPRTRPKRRWARGVTRTPFGFPGEGFLGHMGGKDAEDPHPDAEPETGTLEGKRA